MNAPGSLPMEELTHGAPDTRLPLARARHLPGPLYVSEELAQIEKDRIWMRDWLLVGRAEQIPAAGDYFTFRVAGEPIVVARNEAGDVNAFLNMCIHRGVEVASGAGNAKDFSCPYHAWLYDLEGRLVVAPHMNKAEVDLGGVRLKPLATMLWRDWIFVTFNPQPLPFAEFIAPYENTLWWFRTEQCRLAERLEFRVKCNWKFLVENLIDIYHVPVLHKASFGGNLRTNKDDIGFTYLPRGGWLFEQESRPHSKTGKPMFPPLPWLDESHLGIGSKAGIYPNLNLSARYDSLRLWQLWPVSTTETLMHVYLLFPEATIAAPDFAQSMVDYKAFIAQIVAEDSTMVVSLQHAAGSRFYAPGPMSHMEGAVHHIVNHYLDVIGA